ncbi:hypothetical protein PSTT_17051 [Puccinia striiformis]|uniref:Uncharacterized protein n=1 Tax=Puccinia striiformis TaxID=27350 RepID=A0A2S4UA14_9BASI|nr:hypothetical protein PSTT_17051 [Puccinia striiformis]
MAGSRSKKADRIKSKRLIQQQGDLVISGFKGLISVIEEFTGDYSSTRPTHTTSHKIDHMSKLESRLLPQLQKQINTILEPLVAPDSPDEPCSRLQSILDFQPRLLVTLKQIKSAIRILDPGSDYENIGHIDQDHNELKPYRLDMIYDTSRTCLQNITFFFQACNGLIKELKLSTNARVEPEDDVSVNGEDLDAECRKLLKEIQTILNYSIPERPLQANYPTSDDDNEDIEEALLPVLKSFEPVLKLTRLYLSKLTLPSMDRKLVSYCTEMSSRELRTLDQLGCDINLALGIVTERLSDIICEAEPSEYEQSVEAGMEELQDVFKLATPLILQHFVPIIPETEGLQNYLREWFNTWNSQITLAINNFMVAFKNYELQSDQSQSDQSQSDDSQSNHSESQSD